MRVTWTVEGVVVAVVDCGVDTGQWISPVRVTDVAGSDEETADIIARASCQLRRNLELRQILRPYTK